jgi:hypothetical protein
MIHFACAENFSWNSYDFVFFRVPVDAAEVDRYLISPRASEALGDVSPYVDVVF